MPKQPFFRFPARLLYAARGHSLAGLFGVQIEVRVDGGVFLIGYPDGDAPVIEIDASVAPAGAKPREVRAAIAEVLSNRTWRAWLVCWAMASEAGGVGAPFAWSASRFLDLLGYRRRRDGRHQQGSFAAGAKLLEALAAVKVTLPGWGVGAPLLSVSGEGRRREAQIDPRLVELGRDYYVQIPTLALAPPDGVGHPLWDDCVRILGDLYARARASGPDPADWTRKLEGLGAACGISGRRHRVRARVEAILAELSRDAQVHVWRRHRDTVTAVPTRALLHCGVGPDGRTRSNRRPCRVARKTMSRGAEDHATWLATPGKVLELHRKR